MRFQVQDVGHQPPSTARSQAFLITDNWNDYWEYRTQYFLVFVDRSGARHDIGNVKIGMEGMPADGSHPPIPHEFEVLPDQFFSVGQDDSYYTNLNDIGPKIRDEILGALRDIAKDPEAFSQAKEHPVTTKSLLRDVQERSVAGQFRRIANGGTRLTPYQFTYISPPEHGLTLKFDVVPEARPPTNVHVLIGRNGVGKTHVMNAMAHALLLGEVAIEQHGHFVMGGSSSFVNLVFVSFSAFDLFQPFPEDHQAKLAYAYVGLQYQEGAARSRTREELRDEFVKSVERCDKEPTRSRWKAAVELLESDPVFHDASPSSLLDPDADRPTERLVWSREGDPKSRAARLFGGLSSGHKIVLLTITRLVESVAEQSLVLMDEPETHLHPPLLAAFIRALSNLLIDRNGVAIIATHSPVVLQEVPKTCVWKLRRSGRQALATAHSWRPSARTLACSPERYSGSR